MSELSDAEAVARVRSGDAGHAAFRAIYERHVPEVLRFQRRLLGDAHAAEDAAQETFVRLHRGFQEGFDASRPLRPYVLSVARNVAIDLLRARGKKPKSEPLAEVAAPEMPDLAALSEERRAVEEALGALAPEHRSLIVLRHVHDVDLSVIAESSACTTRTIRNRLRAAASLLARELERRGIIGKS